MSSDMWKNENTVRYTMRFVKSTGIPAGLKEAAEKMQIAESAYIRQAVIEKLIRDGYLKAGEPD